MDQLDSVDLNKILTQVLNGKQQIVSYAGTSQYHVQDVGNSGSERTTISACGPIALNYARTVFRLHKEANRPLPVNIERERNPLDLLRSVLSEQTAEVRNGIGLIREMIDCNYVGNHIYIDLMAQQRTSRGRRYPRYSNIHEGVYCGRDILQAMSTFRNFATPPVRVSSVFTRRNSSCSSS